jgi:polyisoprenoid-binding protein YceI
MPNRNIVIISLVLFTIVAIGGGVWAYDFVLGDTEAPSGSITAIPLVVNTAAPPTTAPTVADQPSATEADATAEPTTAAVNTAPESGPVVFQISPDQSEVRFSIYEELGGQPKTVVGATNQVAGQIAVDLNDLSKVQVGVIQINARALSTDNNNRNRTMRNRILETDQYEFITFTPTAVIGLSGAAQPGQTFTFQIAGALTIRDITQPVVFNVTVQGESLTRLAGTATTVVRRSDYNLIIPSVPNVANVGEEVTLDISFVAEAL